jgi:hypothetical protein
MSTSPAEKRLEQGDLREAERCARREVEAAPDSAEARLLLARVQWRRGRLADAKAGLDQAMRLDPSLPRAGHLRGRILSFEHRWDAAAGVLRQVCERRETPAVVHDLVTALYMADRYAEAGRACQRLAELQEADGHLYRQWRDRSGLLQELASRRPYALTGALPASLGFLPDCDLPTVTGEVNGQGCRLLVDTGGGELLVRESLARRAGLGAADGEGFPGRFAGGTTARLRWGIVEELKLGPLRVRDVPAVRIADPTDEPAQWEAVVGVQLLRRFRSCFDYPGGRLVLADPLSTFAPPAHARSVPFYILSDHYTIAYGRLENGPEEPVFVDSGGTFGLALTPAKFRQVYGTAPAAEPRHGRSAVAEIEYREFPVRRFRLGNVEAHDLDGVLDVLDEQLGSRLGFAIDIQASHNFLRRFHVTWDYCGRRLWFE